MNKASAILIGLLVPAFALPVRAQDDVPGPTRADFTKLQAEVREQRSLIIQMLQTEQQRYDMLLRLLQVQNGGAAAPALPLVAAPEPAAPEAAPSPGKHARAAASAPEAPEHRAGAIEGKVSVADGEVGEVYVYVENVKGPPARSRTIEIRQEGKQFSPRVAVVQTGTTVFFPNFDAIYHNVFSNSSRNSFDLGSYRAGEKPRSVTLTAPGVVDIFCNMHQKMSASVLVVPSPLYTKVKADGTFRLENVPVGQRRVVAWSPHAKPSHQKVDVTPGRTQASFVLEHEEHGAHTNKLGQAYGSYRD